MDRSWTSLLALVCLLVGLWLAGDFEGTLPSYRDVFHRAPDTTDGAYDVVENSLSRYMAVELPLPSIEKPRTAESDVSEVLTLDVRRSIFEREWVTRQWVNGYVQEHHPIDEESLLRGDIDAWQDSVEKSNEMWERVYYVECEAPICDEFGIPAWMLHQVITEGLEKGWHCGLPGAHCP